MPKKTVRIITTGEPVASVLAKQGSFSTLIREAAGDAWREKWEEIDARHSELLLVGGEVAAVIVTGSPASVLDRDPWMLRTQAYLRDEADLGTPILGVCFGHQLLAEAFGGRVERNPEGREIGTVELTVLKADPLLDPHAQPFLANMTHVDAVTRMPKGAESLAQTAKDPHAIVRFRERVWGVQFHPEITGDVMAAYVRARWELLLAEGADPGAILAAARDADAGTSVLRRFLGLVASLST